MKKLILILTSAMVLSACAGDADKKTEAQEQKAVEMQVEQDQKAMDSLEKAIQMQIDAVSDDSLMNAEH